MTRRRVALVFAAWLAFGLWQPRVGGPLGSALIGVFCLTYVVRYVRAARCRIVSVGGSRDERREQ